MYTCLYNSTLPDSLMYISRTSISSVTMILSECSKYIHIHITFKTAYTIPYVFINVEPGMISSAKHSRLRIDVYQFFLFPFRPPPWFNKHTWNIQREKE
jgi:hypothetical protein